LLAVFKTLLHPEKPLAKEKKQAVRWRADNWYFPG